MGNPLALSDGTVADYKRQYREQNGLGPNDPLPFSVDEIRKIGGFLRIDDNRTLVELRQDLRIIDEGTRTAQRILVRPTTKERHDRIVNEIIKPADKLFAAMGDWDINGIHSDFIFPRPGPEEIPIRKLRKELTRYRNTAQDVADWLDETKGPKRRDASEVRQLMVNSLLHVYLYFCREPRIGRVVSRTEIKQHPRGGESHEDGGFSAFSKMCGKIILGRELPLDSYIREAIKKHKEKNT